MYPSQYLNWANIPEGKKATVTFKDISTTPYIPFSVWGSFGTDMCIVNVMHQATKQENTLLIQLFEEIDPQTNISTLPPPKSISAQKNRSNTLKKLINKNLIRKVGIRDYLFNPYFVPPYPDFREPILQHWEKVK